MAHKPYFIPSFHNRWARSATESAYPGLWKGKVGHWVPALGATGNTLRDVSGYGHQGTLTNQSASSVWKVDERGPVIDLDGGTAYFDAGNQTSFDVKEFSVAAWWLADVLPSGNGNSLWFLGKDTSGSRSYTFGLRDTSGAINLSMQINGSTAMGVGDTDLAGLTGEWHHAVTAYDGTNVFYYHDGLPDGSGAFSTDPAITTIAVRLGSRQFTDFKEEWNGKLNDLRLYNRPLTAAEANLLYTTPYADLIPRRFTRVGEAPAVGALGIPIAAFHYNHHLGTMRN